MATLPSRHGPTGTRRITTLAIYALALLLCLLAGTAANALTRPAGRWVTHWTVPLGFCVLVVLLYPLGYLVRLEIAGPAAIALCAVALAVASARRLRSPGTGGGLRRALIPTRHDVAVAVVGTGAGALLLVPVLAVGFPTILALTNNDAWYYAGVVDWLTDHAAGTAVVPSNERPLEASVTIMKQSFLPFGYELVATSVKVLSAREPFAVLGAVAAVGAYASVSGWVRLAEALGARRNMPAVTAAVAATSPMLVLTFAENYLTHFFGLALMPLALATAVRYFARPTTGHLATAALASVGLTGVYVGVLPWQVLMLVTAAVTVGGPWPAWARRPPPGGALGRAGILLLLLGAAGALLNPIATYRAYRFSTLASAFGEGGPFLAYPAEVNLSLLTGAIPTATSDIGTSAALGAGAVTLAALVAVVAGGVRCARAPLVLLAAVLAATALVFLNYHRSGFNYGTYKTIISGGALLAGVLVVALLRRAETRRGAALATGALALCVVVWVPNSAALLKDVERSRPGFRGDDVALGAALRALPQGSHVLVEGAEAGGSPDLFQLRMMTAYFLMTSSGFTASGLWTTPSYMSPGPLPQFRPAAPWDHVLTARPSPFGATRDPVWRSGPFRLARAPVVDVTQYGSSWYAPERDGEGWFQWVGGPSEFVVGNRSSRARRVRLELTAESYGRARTARLSADADVVVRRVRAQGSTTLALELVVPSRGTRLVVLDASPGATPAPAGDPRRLSLKLRDVRVSPRGAAAL